MLHDQHRYATDRSQEAAPGNNDHRNIALFQFPNRPTHELECEPRRTRDRQELDGTNGNNEPPTILPSPMRDWNRKHRKRLQPMGLVPTQDTATVLNAASDGYARHRC